jgi:cobalt-zinc-cadmium efflux system membrane fusion protein
MKTTLLSVLRAGTLCGAAAILAAGPLVAASPHRIEKTPVNERTSSEKMSLHDVAARCAHGAPKVLCFFCDASLREKGRLWCGEHNRYEDRCWECHPDARDHSRSYCDEHFLYEDECFLCRPDLRANDSSRPAGNAPPGAPSLQCEEHRVLESECGLCHPDLADALPPGRGLKVRFASPAAAEKAGVETASPRVEDVADVVECYAEIVFNQNRLARIVAPVSGVVKSVDADLGSRLGDGALLARLWSAAIGEAAAKAVLARQTLERERALRAERITSESDLEQAEAAHRAAWEQLRTLGFDEAQLERLAAKPDEPSTLQLRAPFAGEIVERSAVQGSLVESGTPLFTLADRSVMWVMLNIPEKHISRVRLGQKVELAVESLPGVTFTGTLDWISAEVDERTRMVLARAEVRNPERLLRARMFGRATLVARQTRDAVIVPTGAVQQVGNNSFVFVRLSDDLYEARRVELGVPSESGVEVVAGLGAGENVVVARSYVLKSQLLISKLGVGCVDD